MAKNLHIADAIDENLKLVRDADGTNSPLQLSKDKMKVVGDLDVTGSILSSTIYAGQIIGYTRLEGDLTNLSTFEIQNSLTVEDDTHQISFKTPPSETVEIEATFMINVGSTDTRIKIGLSDNTTYNALAQKFEYDSTGISFSDDEVDDSVHVVKWVLQASELAAIGSSNTFYIGFSTSGLTKTAYLQYGLRASHSVADHPFVIKATALPKGIYNGQ